MMFAVFNPSLLTVCINCSFLHLYSIAVARHGLTQKSKGQGQVHTVMKTVTVAQLLVTRAATAMCCCCWRGSASRYDCLYFLFNITIRPNCYRKVILCKNHLSSLKPSYTLACPVPCKKQWTKVKQMCAFLGSVYSQYIHMM